MKKIISSVIILCVVLMGCLKPASDKCNYNDSTATASASEITDMQAYLNSKSISATQHPAGFFYKINTVGTGTAINNLCTSIAVAYKGRLTTTGAIFDSTATGSVASFQLGQVIAGWQKGVPLISKGGNITLYIPPSLGYGATDVKNSAGVVVIPANSKLIFDIDLVNVVN